jgi:ADP-dependent phosphofructokinase/glucokinase
MKDKWRVKYQKMVHLLDRDQVSVLTGFNANIDVIKNLEDLKIDLEEYDSELVDPVESHSDLLSSLKYCVKNGLNEEIRRKNFHESIRGGVERIGGQGGIMANFLSRTGNYTVFYTPLLSEDLADKIDDEVVYPVVDGKFLLKRVKECVNTDRTKKNTIIQFEGEKSGRLIVSGRVKGFGPYFRKGVESNIDKLDEELDRIILSGFQNIKGNFETKLDKAKMQLNKFSVPKHLEYVSMEEEKAEKILNDLIEAFDSIGMDEVEIKEIAEHLGMNITDEPSLLAAYRVAKTLLEEKNLSRVHIHTYRFHLVVTEGDYPLGMEKIQKAMLFGASAALKMAEQGDIPDVQDLKQFDIHDKHIHRLDELEKFGHKNNLEGFPETGKAEIDGLKVVATPNMIHENPERLVGMGDIISAGAFVGEEK